MAIQLTGKHSTRISQLQKQLSAIASTAHGREALRSFIVPPSYVQR